MSGRKPGVHTTPNPKGQGSVNQVNGQVVSTHRIKDRAVDRGRDIAQNRGSEHTIRSEDGQIGRKHSYGNDPIPPRDRNR